MLDENHSTETKPMPQPCHNWIITYYHSLVFNNRIIRLIGTEFGIMLPNFRFLPEFIFAFDLKAVSTYERTITAEGKRKTSRTPVLPAEWKDQFGIPYEEHTSWPLLWMNSV